ncbi:LacI family DNA-binding transcriptional regulator [Sporomusa malonica]|uniref:Transcriptional regulator, LacI family n=1 Tax=Sporomusa malonica TaxID=112901 RepID=A0A1W2F555_9FIRM|nr:LacI family DNA-binding transcriptional regulator [Sporomusa malonica]SMD17053.1 transcriptional regulator, LacI family [Sporomusa malonica]
MKYGKTTTTIKDVARAAGVSIATVSRILNGNAGVSEELAARVTAAVNQLEYRPNAVARALKERKSRSIGLIIPDIENPFFPALVRGVEDAARQHGYAVILCNTDGKPAEEERYIQFLFSKQVDGILFIGGADSEGNLELLSALPMPVVTLDRRSAATKLSAVVCDNYEGAMLAVKHLISLGRQQIAFIGGPVRSSSAIDRRRGFFDTHSQQRMPVNEQLLVVGIYF